MLGVLLATASLQAASSSPAPVVVVLVSRRTNVPAPQGMKLSARTAEALRRAGVASPDPTVFGKQLANAGIADTASCSGNHDCVARSCRALGGRAAVALDLATLGARIAVSMEAIRCDDARVLVEARDFLAERNNLMAIQTELDEFAQSVTAAVSVVPEAPAPALLPAASAPPTHYRNPYLEAGQQLMADLEYEAAFSQFERARSVPSNDLAEDVLINLYSGIAQAELRHEDLAQRFFKLALSLSPDAQIPVSVSPKVRAIFVEAKAQWTKLRGQPIPAVPVTPSEAPPPPLVSVVPAVEGPPAALTPPPESTQPSPRPRPWGLAPWIVGGVAVAAGVTGGGFGFASLSEQRAADAAYYQNDAITYSNRSRTEAWVANGCYVGAGVLAVATVVLAIASGRSGP
jgi:tetratricopeptide (TPR) repeat protein